MIDGLVEMLTESVKRNGDKPLTNKKLLFFLKKAKIKNQFEQENKDSWLENSWEWHNA